MAVVTSEFEIDSSLPASKLFNAYCDYNHLAFIENAPRVNPETYKALVAKFGDGIPYSSGMTKIDAVNYNNFSIRYTIFEGDVSMGQFYSTIHHVKFMLSPDGGCVYKETLVHNRNGETQLPKGYINMAKEEFKKTCNAIAGFIHANLHNY